MPDEPLVNFRCEIPARVVYFERGPWESCALEDEMWWRVIRERNLMRVGSQLTTYHDRVRDVFVVAGRNVPRELKDYFLGLAHGDSVP